MKRLKIGVSYVPKLAQISEPLRVTKLFRVRSANSQVFFYVKKYKKTHKPLVYGGVVGVFQLSKRPCANLEDCTSKAIQSARRLMN